MTSKNISMEITTEILTQLPIKTLSRFKCVSKSWKYIIESPEFFKLHLKKSLKIDSYNCSLIINSYRTLTIDGSPIIMRTLSRAYLDLNDIKLSTNKLVLPLCFQSETSPKNLRRYKNKYRRDTQMLVFGRNRIAGSCNGLVLILGGEHHIAVCNPSIEKQNSSFKILPYFKYRGLESHYQSYNVYFENESQPRYAGRRFYFRVFGLGYDSRRNCYKVVTLTAKRALIYNLVTGRNSWREIDLPDLEHNFTSESVQPEDMQKELCIEPHNPCVFANNHLHWNVTWYGPDNFGCLKERILSLDLRSEVWAEVQVPDELDQGYFLQGYIVRPYIVEFGVLNGSLCLLTSRGISYPNLQLWIMKEYGVKDSWTMLCNVPIRSGIPLVYRTDKNEFLLPGTQQGLGWYNPQKRKIRKVEFHGCDFTGEHYYSNAVTRCIESFVDPLASIDGESSQKIS